MVFHLLELLLQANQQMDSLRSPSPPQQKGPAFTGPSYH